MTGPLRDAEVPSDGPGGASRFQRLCLRVTLWTLGIGAVVGAAMMLAGLYSGGGRVLATCFVAAASAGLLAAVSGWLEDRGRRWAGAGGVMVVVLAFACSILAIWGDAMGLWGTRTQYRLFGTVMSLVLVAGPAVALLAFESAPVMRWATRIGVPALVVLMGCVLRALWGPALALLDELILTLIWAIPCVVAALVNHGRDRRHWRWLGVIAAALLGADGASMLLGNGTFLPGAKPLLWATAGSAAYANVALTGVLPTWAGLLRWTAIGCAVVGAYLAALTEPWNAGQQGTDGIAFRVIAALSLIGACSTVGLVVAWRLGSTRRWAARAEAYRAVRLTCPRCAKRQFMALPGGACVNCGLTFRISVYDERCAACGYDAAGLRSPVCPECGAGVVLRSSEEPGA